MQAKTTSSEFVEWNVYLNLEEQQTKPVYYYLMQIAKEIRLGNLKPNAAKKLKITDFLIEFGGEKKKKKPTEKHDSKSTWLKYLGLGHLVKKEDK